MKIKQVYPRFLLQIPGKWSRGCLLEHPWMSLKRSVVAEVGQGALEQPERVRREP
jgi:hypothetical protein